MFWNILFVAIGLCLTIVYLVKQVYLFQIKEYRFDRIRARIEDRGLFDFFYGLDVRVPSRRKPRNIVLLLTGTFFLTILSQLLPQYVWVGVLLIIFAPIIAFIICAGGVLATELPVALYRRNIIQKAKSTLRYIQPTIIGITGSYGKTTTKDYLFHILSHTYKTAKTDKNQNTAVGVALSILKSLTQETRYFVVEMGAYKQGEIAEITAFARPKIAIITAMGSQHLSLFGDKEALFRAKSEIVKDLPEDGRLFLASNIDKILKFRFQKLAVCPVEEFEVVSHNPHQTAINAATAVAKYIGIPNESIQRAALSMETPSHLRSQAHPLGYEYIDCSYSSNVEGFIAHLHILRSVKKPKKIVLSSGIIELGKYKKDAYREILGHLPPHSTLYTSDQTFQEVVSKSQSRAVVYSPSHSRLIALIKQNLNTESAILVEGKFRPDLVSEIIA